MQDRSVTLMDLKENLNVGGVILVCGALLGWVLLFIT